MTFFPSPGRRSCLITIVLLLSTGSGAMTSLSGDEEEGYKLPFRVRGGLSADAGWETPDLSFRQNTLFRLSAKHDIARNIATEIQFLFSYSNTDNQFSASIKKGSFLDQNVVSFLDSSDIGGDRDSTNWSNLLDFGEVALNSRIVPKLNVALDRAAIAYRGRFAHFTLGKQVVAWGSGYAWNPTDAINLKNPLDPTEPRKGVGAVVMDVPFREWFLLTLAMAPGKIIDESTEGLRLKFMNRFFDLALSANVVGGSERVLLNIPMKAMAGIDVSTVLFKRYNLWFESSSSALKELIINQTVVGCQTLFFQQLRVLVEFYRNSQGLARPYPDQDKVSRNLALVALGDMGGLGRRYATVGLLWTLNERWEIAGIMVANQSDGSKAFQPQITWQPVQDFKLYAKSSLFKGSAEETEFGSFKNIVEMKFEYLF